MATDLEKLATAAERADSASQIAYDWANGLENEYVTTDNGEIPTIAEYMRGINEALTSDTDSLFSQLDSFKEEISTEVKEDFEEQLESQENTFNTQLDSQEDTFNELIESQETSFSTQTEYQESTFSSQLANQQHAFEAQISDGGYTVVGNFTDGCTVSGLNEAVYYEGDNAGFYAWNGGFPKVVSSDSSPFDEEGWTLAATGYMKQSSAVQLFGKVVESALIIPSNQNALSINPTISEGGSVSVPSDSIYLVLGSIN